jgi:hypothetical protein
MTDEQKVQAFDWMAQRLRFAYTAPRREDGAHDLR